MRKSREYIKIERGPKKRKNSLYGYVFRFLPWGIQIPLYTGMENSRNVWGPQDPGPAGSEFRLGVPPRILVL